MKILLTGSTGFVGRNLLISLREKHAVFTLKHSAGNCRKDTWDYKTLAIDSSALEKCDAVIHLSGANITGGLWTRKYKEELRNSRVQSTKLLISTMAKSSSRPSVFICASAIGYYGDGGELVLTEDSPRGDGFLSDVALEWEEAASAAQRLGIRVISARFGIVIHPTGGALKKMLPMFNLGLGGALGDGSQYWSWISMTDVVRAFNFCLDHDAINGCANFTAPEAVQQQVFADALSAKLGRRNRLKAPAWLIKMLLGEMAQEIFLNSTRVHPKKLIGWGFKFKHPHFSDALDAYL